MVEGINKVEAVLLMNNMPLVSICCITYNHAPFIKKCLDGFLMQETSFPIEILIHDDASSDGTDTIVREYAERYPDLIFPLYETENQYSKGKSSVMDIVYNYSRAKGKYIAYCEGDDYWTDPLKLKKQVDFMEAHPDYSVCFHRCKHLNSDSGRLIDDACGSLMNEHMSGIDITPESFFNDWITQPLTMMFRLSSFSFDWQKKYKYYRDTHEIYHLLNCGRGYLLNFYGGIRIKHKHGISSSMAEIEHCKLSYAIAHELYYANLDNATRINYENVIKWYLQCVKPSLRDCFSICYELYAVSHDFKTALKLFCKNSRIISIPK